MASEVLQGYDDNNIRPPAMPTGPLPQYPEMIMAAIETLNEPSGSNKSSISRQIESTYGNLPPAHTTLLTHHLNKMKSAGQLVFLKNNYLKPDPNAPARRGRGRPPKPKTDLPPNAYLSPPRPRGRPPKSNDPSDPHLPPKPKPKPTSPTASLSGKKRGRPPKSSTAGLTVRPPSTSSGAPRGRGRPPKEKPAMAAAPVGA